MIFDCPYNSKGFLTHGKFYKIFAESDVSYLIQSDDEWSVWIGKSNFKSIEEYRDSQLKQILGI